MIMKSFTSFVMLITKLAQIWTSLSQGCHNLAFFSIVCILCACRYMCIRAYNYVCLIACICACMYVCMYSVCMCSYMYYVPICIYVCVSVQVCVHVCACMYECVCACVNVCSKGFRWMVTFVLYWYGSYVLLLALDFIHGAENTQWNFCGIHGMF